MRRTILCAGMGFAVWLAAPAALADVETCVACDRQVLVQGEFEHNRGRESLAITGAPRRGEEAFREEITGTNFSLSVPNLPRDKYTVVIGLAEVVYTNAGQRAFDITCGSQTLARHLDVFTAAGGAGRVLLLTNRIDFPGDAAGGPLTLAFTGRTGTAKLNTFELKDASGMSLISFEAADLIDAGDTKALQPPVVTGPEIWKDPAAPVAARVNDLVRRLSLAEKVQQLRNNAPAIPRLGIPAYNYWSECLHGVARAGRATVFPQAIGLAATWDVPLLRETAGVIATEARAKHNDYVAAHDGNSGRYFGLTFWTPNINLFRDPRWGRGQETYGEDPFLTARLGVAFIRGLQGDDPKYLKAMACAKHFAVHSGPESERHRFDVSPPERDFYETYLPHFEAAVREGHVGAVMGAYNSVYGKPACASPLLLTDLLRRQWGFDGHVVSDCGAIYDIWANHKFADSPEAAAAAAIQAGDDLCCGKDYNALVRAVRKGLIGDPEIDTAVRRVLEARFRLGLFDPPDQVPYAQIPVTENDTPAHEALALQAARESIVLLKNDGLLPLDRAKIKRIAVIGTNAAFVPVLLGNYNGTPARPVTLLEGIQRAAGTNIQVIYEPGCPLALGRDGSGRPDAQAWTRTISSAWMSDVIVYVGGISPRLEGEEMSVDYEGFSGGDRTQIELPAVQSALLEALLGAGKPVVFVNCSGSAMAMPWVVTNVPAILQAWYPGEQGGRAVAEVLFGDVNPAGRLPVTFYHATTDLPAFDDYSMANRTYRYFKGRPDFAFGHGLSYTSFDYNTPALNGTNFTAGDTLKLRFQLLNAGNWDGDEVAQVYFRHRNSSSPQPRLALCGFARLHLQAHQGARLTLDIPAERFRSWDPAKKQYVVEPGNYELLVGAASDDIRLRVPLKIVTAK
ncbi:MAG TPA: glycoside hydrolase family 3 C-terminal domain-containing protein [Candidatus Acidoferrum sp.]|nr:glycoside hydrolase family 3 C-terminal domain-containing protein [Candidatus Acidoferrum sp.]